MDCKEEIEIRKVLIQEELEKIIKTPHKTNINDAMGYSLLNKGKRIRPLLLLAAYESICNDQKKPISFACALEMIHTYSLIIDDLPSMDDDDYRRGKLTTHKVYGEGIAILAGNGLLNKAHEVMIEICLEDYSENRNALRAMNIISKAAGTEGMIAGQTMDILCQDKKIDEETLLYIHHNKTGALISASIKAGAALAGVKDDELGLYEEAGKALGLAFQIKDDLLEITSTTEVLGKNVNSDRDNNKSTYITIFGKEKANEDFVYYSEKAIEVCDKLKAPLLKYLAESLVFREK